ncbi:homeobox protein knotted-1-like 6 [Cocos nucifera]|uniref:Homeobox protein knotted-1-like 6 n=1 Tax=Cocos nucifera TaxID=13894 RepID=A0A8K0IAT9_COCNU|nr:homeobox protein knotted-1-like 6 [Cocos nucifera]
MEEMYGMHFVAATGGGLVSAEELQVLLAAAGDRKPTAIAEEGGQETAGDMKARIASHPRYPKLLEAYINCQKVGAPPEMPSFLDDIRWENDTAEGNAVSSLLGADPELDEFMVSSSHLLRTTLPYRKRIIGQQDIYDRIFFYKILLETFCDVLVKYRSDLARPFHEATTFFHTIERQLSDLCKPSTTTSIPYVSGKRRGTQDGVEGEKRTWEVSGGDWGWWLPQGLGFGAGPIRAAFGRTPI